MTVFAVGFLVGFLVLFLVVFFALVAIPPFYIGGLTIRRWFTS